MRSCRDPQRPQICDPEVVAGDPYPCEPLDLCVGNYHVHWDGACLTAEPRQDRIPDGTFSTITFRDGCIVGVGDIPAPVYTPNECCGAPGGGGTPQPTDVPISADPNNLTYMKSDGLFTGLYYRQGQGVTITGVGSLYDPIIITALQQEQQGINVTGLPPIRTVGDGAPSSGLTISMVPGPMLPGTYGPITVDAYGLVQDFDADWVPNDITITGVPPIVAEKLSTTNFKISLPIPEPSPAGVVTVGPYAVIIGLYGTVESVERTRGPITPGRFYTPQGTTAGGETIPAKIVEYDADGFIVNVANA